MVSFLGLAALFVGLDAFFIAVIQVLVYAGAVMVLFLFIIMLLDLKAERRRRVNLVAVAGGLLVTAAFALNWCRCCAGFQRATPPFPRSMGGLTMSAASALLLFTNYNLPFQVIGVLVLVATIGVSAAEARRELKNECASPSMIICFGERPAVRDWLSPA